MKPHIYAVAPAPKVNHRTNRLLAALEPDDFAALEPHLHAVSLQQDQVLYEAGDPLRHAPPPHSFLRHPISGQDPQKGDDDDRDDEGCGRSGPWWAHVAPAQA
jgi:hypothetical protein